MALRSFPTFAGLEQTLGKASVGEAVDSSQFGRAASTLLTIGEIAEIGAGVYDRGYYSTPGRPSDEKFASMALEAYGSAGGRTCRQQPYDYNPRKQ